MAVLARREECVFAGMDAAAPVYMLAAWRWGVEWPSGELSYDFIGFVLIPFVLHVL